jgi:nucleotide-binding universal stress UspA family protein
VTALHRILVATDFSTAGHAAVARAGQLAGQFGSALTVFHATPDWRLFSQRATAHQEHYAQITRNADELMRAEVGWLDREYHLHARSEIHRDRATPGIVRAVGSVQPDMLVIGAGGEQVLPDGGTVLGGTALKLVGRIAVPLLLVRDSVPAPYRTSMAAVFGEPGATQSLVRWASALAGSGTCHVVRPYEAPYLHRMRLCQLSEAQITECAEEQRLLAQAECAALAGAVQGAAQLVCHVVRGAPLPTVLGQVAALAPQLLVIGQHAQPAEDQPGAGAVVLGARIAYHCPTDVLLIP